MYTVIPTRVRPSQTSIARVYQSPRRDLPVYSSLRCGRVRALLPHDQPPYMKATVIRSLLASLLLSGLGLAWIVFAVGRPEDLLIVFKLPGTSAVAAIACMLATMAFGGLRLKFVCERSGLSLTFRHAARTHILGMFSATVTPGGSGQTPAIALMLQHHGASSSAGWAAGVAIFRADAIFHAWGLPAAVAILYGLGLIPSGTAWVWFGAVALVLTLAIAYLMQFKLHWLRPVTSSILRGPLLRVRRRGLRFIDEMLDANATFAEAPFAWQLGVQGLTLGSWISLFTVLFVLAQGLSIPLTLLGAIAIQIVISAAGVVVPTPGGSGFYELAISYLLIAKGGESNVPAVVLVWRLITYYSIFLIGPMLGGYVVAKLLQQSTDPRGEA